jgi:DNA-binding MarR family transcriptional regulator
MAAVPSAAADADAEASGAEEARREAWSLFWRIFMADKSRRWQALAALGLTPMQGQALMILSSGDPLPMSALADRMQCDNSNITGIADRLEGLGLVERRPAPRDRRVKTLALTDRGQELCRQVSVQVGQPPAGFDALDAQEAATLGRLLAKAVAAQPGA